MSLSCFYLSSNETHSSEMWGGLEKYVNVSLICKKYIRSYRLLFDMPPGPISYISLPLNITNWINCFMNINFPPRRWWLCKHYFRQFYEIFFLEWNVYGEKSSHAFINIHVSQNVIKDSERGYESNYFLVELVVFISIVVKLQNGKSLKFI